MLCADSASTSNILVHALQVSLEYSVVDRSTFSTHQERLLPALYVEAPDQEAIYEQQLRTASTRLITLLAALKVAIAVQSMSITLKMVPYLSKSQPHHNAATENIQTTE